VPEVADGIDNDCNGIVDDVSPARIHPRALVFGPAYMWTDAKSDIASVATLLDQAGVPYDVQAPNSDWVDQIGSFARYSLIIVPGYLEGAVVDDAMIAALEAFASGGGVVFIMKPIGSLNRVGSLQLAGVKSATRAKRTTALVIRATAPALAAIDSPEERVLPVTDDAKRGPMDVWTFEIEGNTQVIAEAYADNLALGAAATRRPLGRGAIYAWGHNLATFDSSRCYMNCFEPSGDVLRLFLRDALREGALGHVVLKHPIPGPSDSVLVLTHDVDAADAYGDGAWGEAGALQMAAMEKRNGVRATYNYVTDYVTGTFNPEVVERLCKDGFCEAGAQSVRRLRNFGKHPRGTCRETRESYGAKTPATLCGEVRVSLEILSKLTSERPRAWRSPNLADNPFLFDVLADSAVTLDSSFGIGDLKYNLPVDTALSPKLQHRFHHQPLFEFPIALEDGRRVSAERTELQSTNLHWFETQWEYTMLRNAANGSITTLVVRPTRGHGTDDDNIKVKVDAVEHLIKVARAHRIDVDSLVHFGDFWRARSKVAFDASYDAIAGYTGWFQTGDLAIQNLTFEMGDAIASFECAACGKVEVTGKRVVMRDRLAPGTRATFTAKPRDDAPKDKRRK
jgi:hypothetical protein